MSTRASMGRRRRANGLEQDATSRWVRRRLGYLQRPGVRSQVKTSVRRRERHQSKQEMRSLRDAQHDHIADTDQGATP